MNHVLCCSSSSKQSFMKVFLRALTMVTFLLMDAANQLIMAPLTTPTIPRLISRSCLMLASKQVLVISFPGEVTESPFCDSSPLPDYSLLPTHAIQQLGSYYRQLQWDLRRSQDGLWGQISESDQYVDWSWQLIARSLTSVCLFSFSVLSPEYSILHFT